MRQHFFVLISQNKKFFFKDLNKRLHSLHRYKWRCFLLKFTLHFRLSLFSVIAFWSQRPASAPGPTLTQLLSSPRKRWEEEDLRGLPINSKIRYEDEMNTTDEEDEDITTKEIFRKLSRTLSRSLSRSSRSLSRSLSR